MREVTVAEKTQVPGELKPAFMCGTLRGAEALCHPKWELSRRPLETKLADIAVKDHAH
jgi:hypothetical protein